MQLDCGGSGKKPSYRNHSCSLRHIHGCSEYVSSLVIQFHKRLNSRKVVAIPVSLLWRVRMKAAQKLALGVFLCLSVCMIIAAIVRLSTIRYHGKPEAPWSLMWHHIEACVAVTMLSLTAFRSVFVGAKPDVDHNKASPWVPSTDRLLRRLKKPITGDQQRQDDLNISSTVLTDLSPTFSSSTTRDSVKESVRWNNGPAKASA